MKFAKASDNPIEKPEGRILLIDDDNAQRHVLQTTLVSAGFKVTEVATGEEALALARVVKYDVVLLALCMPGKKGIEICRHLRRHFPRLGILMLGDSEAEDGKIEALDSGADGYISKPIQIRVLLAHVRAATRRAKTSLSADDAPLKVGEIELLPTKRQVYRSKVQIHLTPKEFDVLYYLMAHSGKPISHAELLGAVWGPNHVDRVEYLRTFIRQLRKKLEEDAGAPQHILTQSYIGYRFGGEER